MAGVDCVSTVAGETKRPSYTVIRALLGCMAIVTLQYFFVLSTAAGIDGDNWQNWEAGALSGVAKRAFGDFYREKHWDAKYNAEGSFEQPS
mmetsp:Transcript_5078/g.4319  ORF Transcript_5078/g.4319 Transcript_5078/m.4319 type:complete len:91 (+) Transcript_5078:31-303(+)